ncbi:sigma-70 family RNA polymerase sigma factor [Hyalangium rubrum]|uniref:Sigma-70 family RNA polymerase sigma factor n=1 Tax=Hyalangium rubrum TaxID=3103134 RepID=A0ABU5HAQ6_9BACT|nr:sigma-70 family RNA polymerase sigma factor [Hyalangium sp. s54d21]MDY7230396.1 sigma-70 family RNA polymerase sigma factor [Hyalangium sp. s54d21]
MDDGMASSRSPRGLERLFREGREAWPSLALEASSFMRHVARHVPERSDPEKYLEGLHGADLYLACACKEGVPGAVAAFQASYGATVEAALRGRNVPPAEREELGQAFWEKLFVGHPGVPAKIGDYSGRGPLGGWVRVAAMRAALNFFEQRKSDLLLVGARVDEVREPCTSDPELDFLKSHYRDEVHQALKDALAGLEADERNVLRLHFLDGLSAERIATVYGVHRATVARWVARGREALLTGTRQLLTQRLRIEQGEVESILGIVRSQLGLALSSIFRAGDPR